MQAAFPCFIKNLRGDNIQTITRPVKTNYQFRKPEKSDGAAIWNLINDIPVLDLNSSYSYLLWCECFSDTSVIVNDGEETVGFISGFIKPSSPNVLFIWQVAVAETERGQGLATRMIDHILKRNDSHHIQYIEATVSPSNKPSTKLFKGYAEKKEVPCQVKNCFSEDDFPGEGHEEENTFRIGPFKD
ncbi:diaminobutyrate acetyltransferase [Thalassobacillus sp. CUG 92003]|uniref:diaminobutyrate acetyltransferase n=1 Tax=Thalassobacillus sp. CUG 92003 TaxID=2736641 RepID=UPI0015E6B6D9|nr:diaminobutyrate acetyltransferase [Thalassobacillus sp. CUG 92003]